LIRLKFAWGKKHPLINTSKWEGAQFPLGFLTKSFGSMHSSRFIRAKGDKLGLIRDTVSLVFFRLHIGNKPQDAQLFTALTARRNAWANNTQTTCLSPHHPRRRPRVGAATPTKPAVKLPPTNSSIKPSVEGVRYWWEMLP